MMSSPLAISKTAIDRVLTPRFAEDDHPVWAPVKTVAKFHLLLALIVLVLFLLLILMISPALFPMTISGSPSASKSRVVITVVDQAMPVRVAAQGLVLVRTVSGKDRLPVWVRLFS